MRVFQRKLLAGLLPFLTAITAVFAQDVVKPVFINDARTLIEQDVATLVALASEKGGRPWLINIECRLCEDSRIGTVVETFFIPDTSTAELRRGKFAYGSAVLHDAAPYFSSMPGKYAQAPLPGRDPNAVQDEHDVTRPFEVQGDFTDAELITLVKFIRSRPAAPLPDQKQPVGVVHGEYPISHVLRVTRDSDLDFSRRGLCKRSDVDAVVRITDNRRGAQIVPLRRQDNTWLVVPC